MKRRQDNRSLWIKIRVTADEKALIKSKADSQQQTITDFIRQRCLHYRLRQMPLEKQILRQLAAIGSNLNQIARWVNTYKTAADALDVLSWLMDIEHAIRDLTALTNCNDDNASCT